MAVDPVIRNQVIPPLRQSYLDAVSAGEIPANQQGFQLFSYATGHGLERKFWAANDEGMPIESLGSVTATPTICG